ncbi:MAG: 8-oxo-dGTP pyrophosphatase MutT (NUDIX family) [Bacteroidia bacterium]|jgi:8-oxo-dGTP pyrophosphatase MutT (NUDIX family)
MTLLPLSHPLLNYDGNPKAARTLLESWVPPNADQEEARACILQFMEENPRNAHLRECVPGHLTASSIVIHSDGKRGLFTLHKKLNRWLQLGGHCDGDANLPASALREAVEESGIDDLVIDPRIVDLDIHLIPERPAKGDRPAEPAHLHLDTRFFVYAPEGAEYVLSDESHELAWFTAEEIAAHEADDSVMRLVGLALGAPAR